LSGLLERVGVEVVTANDGAQALERIAEQCPDIVFMDLRIPVMDGLTAVRHLRERWPKKPIVCVAITASGLLRQRSVYLDAAFDDFIGKSSLLATGAMPQLTPFTLWERRPGRDTGDRDLAWQPQSLHAAPGCSPRMMSLEDAPSRRGRRSHGQLSYDANHQKQNLTPALM
jgi:CheY-like chemotaxis protein